MSRRARVARRLAGVLKVESGSKWVELRYHRQQRCYAVHWEGPATAAEMYEVVAAHAAEMPELDVNALVWLRTEPHT